MDYNMLQPHDFPPASCNLHGCSWLMDCPWAWGHGDVPGEIPEVSSSNSGSTNAASNISPNTTQYHRVFFHALFFQSMSKPLRQTEMRSCNRLGAWSYICFVFFLGPVNTHWSSLVQQVSHRLTLSHQRAPQPVRESTVGHENLRKRLLAHG